MNETISRVDFKLRINNTSSFKIYYSYNNNTTFQDLLEYLARLFTSLNICDCYQFEINEVGKISKDSKICNYYKKLGKLNLYKKNDNNCNHSNNNYLKEGKKSLVSGKLETCVNPNFIDFYDVIVHIDSIKDINKGWKIEMNQKGKQNYQNHKSEKVIKIGVIGNANTGKSFILSKLSKRELPFGMSIKTEGLSIKYPDTTEFSRA